jgi:hypothetical protein
MLPLLAVLVVACTEDDEPTYVQYNDDGNEVEVEVGVDTRYVLDDDGVTEIPETVSVALTSSTGSVEVGTGTVSPSAGPVGTLHTVTVEVLDDYAEDVDRATVVTASDGRGKDEYDLDRDSAGEGIWVFELNSVGEDDEVRTDTFTFRLYEEEED